MFVMKSMGASGVMTHAERWQAAEELGNRLVAAFPGEMILGGVYGSTARGEDTPYSDLEAFFVVRDGYRAEGKHFVFRGIALGYRVIERAKLEALLTHPDLTWPFHMGMLSVLQPLFGGPSLIQAWLDFGLSVREDTFRAALEALLPDLIVESHGRVLYCRERNTRHDA